MEFWQITSITSFLYSLACSLATNVLPNPLTHI
nr:MAG TPA: BM2 protein [Caudoviricetes sp.]